MSRKFYLFLCLMIPCWVFSQANVAASGQVAEKISAAKSSGLAFPQANLFAPLSNSEKADLQNRQTTVKEAGFFNYQLPENFRTSVEDQSNLSMSIPTSNSNTTLTVDLIKVDILSSDFKVNVPFTPGVYYQGIVRGENSSLVAISIFDEEVVGFVTTGGQTMTLGKVKGSEKLHILYNEFRQDWPLEYGCGTSDQNVTFDQSQLPNAAALSGPGDCIRERFEMDESLTNQVGEAQATNYGTGVFNNQKTLYANGGINAVLSELVVWTSSNPAPYILDQYNTLDSYRDLTGAYNGDVAYLGFYQGGWNGGVASAIGGICPNNVDNSKAIGGHSGFYQDVPVYTHDVLIISHELGHLYGARHTHACVWNGNNTAIDGCAGFVEGGCPIPPALAVGTIMSYCNEADFSTGFHPQVAAAIQGYIATRSCTAPCGGAEPTCSDGIQNGDETGIDCGGSCAPCDVPPTCDDGIQNGDETGVDCGGSCAPCDVLPTCNDGIQNGDETGVDCGGSTCPPCGTPPTCNDGVQNGDETGVDCGGSTCPPCGTPPTCDDGIQNGDETGVDCGGSCTPCQTICTDVTLVLNLDNYPKETTWDIKDANNTVVASSNGNYGGEANGATLTLTECLVDGCYTFTVYDHFGDGICCEYGQGSYVLTDASGEVLGSGGEFGLEESAQFCLEGDTPTPFEYCEASGYSTNWEWIESVQIGSINNTSGNNGGYADFTNLSLSVVPGQNLDVMLTPGFSGSTYIEFWRVWIDNNQDGDFDDAGELLGEGSGAGMIGGTTVTSAAALLGETRMRVSMQYLIYPEPCGIFKYGEVEDYTVVFIPGFPGTSVRSNNANPAQLSNDGKEATGEQIILSPNPATDQVKLNYASREGGDVQIEVLSLTGKLRDTQSVNFSRGQNSIDMNVSSLPPGVYMVRMTKGDRQVTEKLTIMN
ncbi:MAG: hypothetical protein ACI956_000069 [Nonlabens sp.]|jgi:hypothetical protein